MSEKTPGLMRVVVTVGDRRFDEDLSAQTFIASNLAGIDEALETGSARTAEWAMLAALAETERDEIKNNVAVLDTQIKDRESQVYIEVYNTAPKPPTGDAIKAFVQTDPARLALVAQKQALTVELLAAADRHRVLEVGRDIMKDRKDYVIERARDARAEMQAKMSVRLPEGETLDRYKPGGR